MKLVNKYKYPLILALLVFVIILANTTSGSLVIGLDNISPYFNFSKNLQNIFLSSNFFLHGPEIFNIPVQILVALGVNASAVSWVDYWLTFVFGATGWYMFISLLTRKARLTRYLNLVLTILVLSSLCVVFVFSQPNMIFRAIFVAVPFLTYALSDEEKSKLRTVALYVGIIYLFLASLNLVLFTLIFVQLIVTVPLIRSILKMNFDFRKFLGKLFVIGLSWIFFVQIILFLSPVYSKSIFSEAGTHLFSFVGNSQMETVTSDLTDSEFVNNTILGVARYKTGWVELHDTNGPLFNQYSLYKENPLIVLLGLIPFILIVLMGPTLVKNKKTLLYTLLAYLFIIFIQSRLGITLRSMIPLISDGTRWLSSKIWPMQLVLQIVLLVYSLKYLSQKKLALTSLLLLLSAIGVLLPVYSGGIFSRPLPVTMPIEYEKLKGIPAGETIFVSPPPQNLYFREYDWGYYGSDFFKFMLNAETLDVSSINDGYELYYELHEDLDNCDLTKFGDNGIQYILIDNSVASENEDSCYIDYEVTEENQYYTLYKVD